MPESFFSGILREPLAGEESICPVDATVSHPVSSPGVTVRSLIAIFEASAEEFQGRSAMNLPALNVTVQQMLDALEAVAGPVVRARVKFQRDERVAGIVGKDQFRFICDGDDTRIIRVDRNRRLR